jgi:hypothetical protein
MKIALILIVLLNTPLMAQNALVEKANKFLSSLPDPLKQKAQYKFDDEERFNWHFVPKSRNGVSFRDFNPTQRDAALDLLRTSLSAQGYQKATAIMELENVLREVEGRGSNDKYRDPFNYYLTIFGSPADSKPWGWRFEGHHIALNFSSISNRIESSTPSFFGSNPGVVKSGPEKGKQILKDETELAFSLVNSFDAEKLKIALISETALPEIVSFNSRKAILLTPAGLSYSSMNDQQKTLLTKLLDTYVRNYELGFSNKLMEKIKKAGIEKLTFSWAGSLKPGTGYYYRIQGPMLLIELDNTQNDANHVHSVVRDLTNDFGEDILREHYEKEHSNH